MQPSQCVLQHHVANPHLCTHLATQYGNIYAAIPLRSATQDSKSSYNCAQTNAAKAYLSSPARATLPKKTMVRAETTSQNQTPATSMQPLRHYIAFCNITSQTWGRMVAQHSNVHAAIPLRSNPKELRTYDAPVIAEHRGGTNTPPFIAHHPSSSLV